MAEPAELRSSRTKWRGGQLLHIHLARAASFKMQEFAEANFVAGRGIEGDRYFLGTGTYSSKPDFREVTVFEAEVLEALARNDPPLQSGPIKIGPNDHRRNLTVTAVPLNHLVGQRFRVGAAVLFGGRLNFRNRGKTRGRQGGRGWVATNSGRYGMAGLSGTASLEPR